MTNVTLNTKYIHNVIDIKANIHTKFSGKMKSKVSFALINMKILEK